MIKEFEFEGMNLRVYVTKNFMSSPYEIERGSIYQLSCKNGSVMNSSDDRYKTITKALAERIADHLDVELCDWFFEKRGWDEAY
jgi:hypothetical protein